MFNKVLNKINNNEKIKYEEIYDLVNSDLNEKINIYDLFKVCDYIRDNEYDKELANKLIVKYNNKIYKQNSIYNSIDNVFNDPDISMGQAFYYHKELILLGEIDKADKFANDFVNTYYSKLNVSKKDDKDKETINIDELIKRIDDKIAELEEESK